MQDCVILCRCVCTCLCLHVCLFVCLLACLLACLFVCLFVFFVIVCLYVSPSLCLYICMYVICIRICVYLIMYVYVRTGMYVGMYSNHLIRYELNSDDFLFYQSKTYPLSFDMIESHWIYELISFALTSWFLYVTVMLGRFRDFGATRVRSAPQELRP